MLRQAVHVILSILVFLEENTMAARVVVIGGVLCSCRGASWSLVDFWAVFLIFIVLIAAAISLTLTVELAHLLFQLISYVVLLKHTLHRLEIVKLGSRFQVRLSNMSHSVDVEEFGPMGHGLALIFLHNLILILGIHTKVR